MVQVLEIDAVPTLSLSEKLQIWYARSEDEYLGESQGIPVYALDKPSVPRDFSAEDQKRIIQAKAELAGNAENEERIYIGTHKNQEGAINGFLIRYHKPVQIPQNPFVFREVRTLASVNGVVINSQLRLEKSNGLNFTTVQEEQVPKEKNMGYFNMILDNPLLIKPLA